MAFRITSTNSRRRGGALIELLVGLMIGGIVLAQICLLWYYSSRSFAAQMSYVEMDQTSQRALDTISREIRQTKALTYYATNRVVFKDADGQPLMFTFAEKQLLRIKGTERRVLLKNCESGGFAIYQRNPVEGVYDQYPAASPATCKLVEVFWLCARNTASVVPRTRESMQSAKIVIRSNDP